MQLLRIAFTTFSPACHPAWRDGGTGPVHSGLFEDMCEDTHFTAATS
jgi:hypothetical protein